MTNRFINSVFLIAMAAPCFAADLSGNWIAEIAAQGEPQYVRVSLQTNGSALTGTWGQTKIEGTLSGSSLDLKLSAADGSPAGTLTAMQNGDSISGTGSIVNRGGRGGGRAGGGGAINFTMKRPAAPPAMPRDLKFEPTDYFATYSAANKPVLTIFPGDIVHTSTADAFGTDAKGVRHRGGDSNVGPFYVEGALPGDTLVVHLLKVRTNRPTARQGTRINAHAVTAAYLLGAEYDPKVTGEWTLLPDKGIAVPTHPSDHMKNYSVPLKPMLGCISVAPAGDEQFRGGDLGSFGGNMDYNENIEGATLYFPVFHAGALLGMGDGHAAMGDGEVTTAALETSLDVDFSVEVIPGASSGQVRAETKDYLIAFGIAGSVPDSIQVATSQLATWIKRDYKLSDSEVAILFAATLKYDITELVDSKYDVVAKIPKSILATMK
jgi:acetamidase/formamidase